MSGSWKFIVFGNKPDIEAALLAHDALEEWDPDLVISGREVAEDTPDEWVLEAWYPDKPAAEQIEAISGLFGGKAPHIEIEQLPDEDWTTLSQQGTEPILAGQFCVRTPGHRPKENRINLLIPASQAFGTGQHETTAGCLEVISTMRRQGIVVRNIADIGTGTGLLAFAALKLWPAAKATASDIDPICASVVAENAKLNDMTIGLGRGEPVMVIADGMNHDLLEMRGPYDLLLANILAGPLVELAPDFARAVEQGGNLILAGLLTTQEEEVRRAYRRNRFRLVARLERGDWSILWLRRRRA
jgi:ribosomal protein L11 methyltransferase